mmetsp:Transcript_34398/g.25474  ORF Transcript_34398/g.25474 Transcript_34398/m.25474 type:complete len:143 (+) Transcript_34398:1292-1720(+)
MAEMDINQDGEIDYIEFMTASINRGQVLSSEKLLAAFKHIDKDGSGWISQEELQAALANDSSTPNFLVQDLLRHMDTNQDGQINMEEFAGAIAVYLKQTYLPQRARDLEVRAELSPEGKGANEKSKSAKSSGKKKGKGKGKK